ncbi:MAG: DUF1883 domain-containing protein [Acidobacteriaceae bacterium]
MTFEINYLIKPVGYLQRGIGVRVDLQGAASDVYLTDDSGLSRLQRGDLDGFLRSSYGGHYTASPVVLGAPSTGRWNVVVIPIQGEVRLINVSPVRIAA